MTPEERRTLIAQYEVGYDELRRAVADFPVEHLTARPIEGKWSACEIVQHTADSEMHSALRLRQLLAEDDTVIKAYDQDLYAARLRYNERDIEPALEAVRAARATTAQLLRRMAEEDWARSGTHPEHGRYTPEHWLRIYAAHAHGHAAQLRRLKEVLRGEAGG